LVEEQKNVAAAGVEDVEQVDRVDSVDETASVQSVETAETADELSEATTIADQPDAADPPSGKESSAPAEPAVRSAAEDAQTSPKQRTRGVRQSRVASLYRALRSGRSLEGSIEKVIKGGYEIKLGKIRGFCPHSQIDLHRVEDPEQHVGKNYPFRVTQVRRGGEDVVVSRRAVLEEERREEASAVRATLLEGALTRGRIVGTAGFGAFVDLGAGVMGLVHVSELSHSRVARVEEAVNVGDNVNVKILKLHESGRKISLSIRQAENDPWATVAETFKAGQTCSGVVQRLTQFGAFVELAPGVEALAPASEFAPSPEGWKHGLEVGRSRDWLVISVDSSQRRISITPPVDGFEGLATEPLQVGALVKGKVQRVENYGIFVWLGPGRVGLMPNALSGAPRDADMKRRFPLGLEVEAEVRELADDGRRIRLASKGAGRPVERRPRREPRPKRSPVTPRPAPSADSSVFGTSLADKLRAALGESAGKS
jgi:small subunit ribosomal protein S1